MQPPRDVTTTAVRDFLLARYSKQLEGLGRQRDSVPDTFDFLLEGVIDSLGILEMVGALEQEFGIKLDMSGLDAEEMTILGPLVRYVVAQGTRTSTSAS